jgi:ABC-type uncharacterized transport system involved in gliding motility auxiliary subunit
MTRRQSRVLTLLTLLVFFFAVLLSSRLALRFDITQSRANTISAFSRKLHEEISGEVRITYYISDRLRAASPIPGEIEDLLREYAAWSRGKIVLVLRDPAKAHLEERIEEMGILPRQIDTIERDRAVFATVYTGIVIEYLDRVEVIPLVFSPAALEYDLASCIRSLLEDRERSVGVIVGNRDRSWNDDYGFAGEALLRSGRRVRELRGGEEIPETLSALLVLGGAGDLDEWALYRIDSFIRGGGNVFFALDGVSVDSRSLEARRVNDRGLLAMTASYGAAVREELVLDRPASRALSYPHWIGIQASEGNMEHPVSSRFGGVDMFWPSPLDLNAPEGVEAVPLFTTTSGAWIMDGDFITRPEDPRLQGEGAPKGKRIMAAALSGTFPSWFAGRMGETENAAASPSRIIVTGNAGMFSFLMQYTDSMERNLDFLIRALDWLGNDDDILGIRKGRSGSGRLDRIADPQKAAAAMRFARILNLILIPLGTAAAGFLCVFRRRRSGR